MMCSSLTFGIPTPCRLHPWGRAMVAGEWCCTWRLCQYCKVCRLHRCEWVARGQNCGCLSSWRDGISGSTATGDCGHRCRWEVRVVCAASSAIVTGSLGVRPQLPWLESWVCRNHLPVPSVLPSLCVPVHPPVAVQMCEFSGHLVCWTEVPLLCCGCFSGCRLKRQSFSSAMLLTSFF